MPKMKTKSGAKKRFRVTGSGRIKFKRSKMRHILAKKDRKVKRRLRKSKLLSPSDERVARKLIPYK